MKGRTWLSFVLLLLTAAIWGFAFVAQRVGARYLGPFTFNGIRFFLGGVSLVPLLLGRYYFERRRKEGPAGDTQGNGTIGAQPDKKGKKFALLAGLMAGTVLFLASTFQQMGMVETSSGKAAFITGLYIILVPLLGLFIKKKVGAIVWLSAVLALTGLFLLCVTKDLTVAVSDLYEIIGAFFWAIHILLIDYAARRVEVLKLSVYQFFTCSVLSLLLAVLLENISLEAIYQAALPIAYGGFCSVGIAYTLQAVAQKNVDPAPAAIILSMESLFATLGGFLLLNEGLTARSGVACLLMLSGMVLAQIGPIIKTKPEKACGKTEKSAAVG